VQVEDVLDYATCTQLFVVNVDMHLCEIQNPSSLFYAHNTQELLHKLLPSVDSFCKMQNLEF